MMKNDNVVENKEFKKIKRDIKIEQAKRKFHDGWLKTKDFVVNNPIVTVAILGAGTEVIRQVGKGVDRHQRKVQADREYDRNERTYWDPKTQTHVMSRRRLTNEEQLRVSERRMNGESTTSILNSMGLLQ